MKGLEMKKKIFTTNALLELFPTLKAYDVDYLVRNKIIPCIKSGRGNPRKFPPEAVEVIRKRLALNKAFDGLLPVIR